MDNDIFREVRLDSRTSVIFYTDGSILLKQPNLFTNEDDMVALPPEAAMILKVAMESYK